MQLELLKQLRPAWHWDAGVSIAGDDAEHRTVAGDANESELILWQVVAADR